MTTPLSLYLILMIFMRNPWKIILRPFGVSETFVSASTVAVIKNAIALWRSTRNSLLTRERCTKRGQGDVPLGLPPPLGERGGHPHSLLNVKEWATRIFSEQFKIHRISTGMVITMTKSINMAKEKGFTFLILRIFSRPFRGRPGHYCRCRRE